MSCASLTRPFRTALKIGCCAFLAAEASSAADSARVSAATTLDASSGMMSLPGENFLYVGDVPSALAGSTRLAGSGERNQSGKSLSSIVVLRGLGELSADSAVLCRVSSLRQRLLLGPHLVILRRFL